MDSNAAITPVRIKSEPIEAEGQQETDQTMNTANQRESQRNTGQTELVLSMSHSARDQLITSLNQLSTILLSSKPIPEDAKQRTRKQINDAILMLVKLSPFKSISTTDNLGVKKTISDQLFVEMSRADSTRFIKHLVAVRDTMEFDHLVAGEIKLDLITENKKIVTRLLNLPTKELSSVSEDKNENDDKSFLKKEMVISNIFDLNEKLDKLQAIIKRQEEQIASLVTNVNKLKIERQKVDTSRAEAWFKFELAGVTKFFEVQQNLLYSDRFWCRGLQWSLKVKRNLDENETKQLGVFLCCHCDDWLKWTCKTNFKLILFNNRSVKKNKTRKFFDFVFEAKLDSGVGYFMSYPKLTDEKNGYIKDDRIVLGVELKAEPVTRTY